MPTEKPRVTFTISQERLSEVESYRFDNKFKNQTQAILSLIDKGLTGIIKETEKAPLYSSEAEKLAQDYDGLDEFGKKAVRAVADVEKARCEDLVTADRRPMIQAAARGGGVTEIESINPDEISGDEIIP